MNQHRRGRSGSRERGRAPRSGEALALAVPGGGEGGHGVAVRVGAAWAGDGELEMVGEPTVGEPAVQGVAPNGRGEGTAEPRLTVSVCMWHGHRGGS